jgi:ABC-type amino acid transport system permease subunit
MFEWLADPRYWNLIVQGLSVTVEITLFGVFLGLC